MSFSNPALPNLELLLYKTKQLVLQDEEFIKKINKEKKKNKYLSADFDVMVFSQIWGSTCTGFDICDDGSPAIGGCAMTKEYTTVIHETVTDIWVIFFGEKPCYKVTDANEAFYNDLKNRNMASLAEAKKRY